MAEAIRDGLRHRLDDKASGLGLGTDGYLTKPFALQELVLRPRALDRRRAHSRPPVREVAGLRPDPFRREVHRCRRRYRTEAQPNTGEEGADRG